MLGHKNVLDEAQFQYETNEENQLQLLGNIQAGRNIDPVNHFGNEYLSSMFQSNKRSREAQDILKQHNVCQDEADPTANIPNPNQVSTGLRLSYDDDERNSSVTSASGSMTATPSLVLPFSDNFRTELDRQQQELDQYIQQQKDQLSKAVRDMKQKHMTSLFYAIEKGVSKKLREKDAEIENINQKNKELAERIKQVSIEAQSWHYKAKYNEQVVNVLRSNLQQAITQGVEQGKEGFGDSSEVDDATSYIDLNNLISIPGAQIKSSLKNQQCTENLTCRVCKAKKVSMLLMPCRHLCLCDNCDRYINVCPVCQLMKTQSIQVYLS
ncbi:hypothetical protein PIB30_012553 [Stylosanthes scabra]|uniref:Uncharacterized protein n=1 Tax=Stylosanthes scabra TaxID=79078 RepID=A0ABU6W5M2_9FABA|nr:hypothetical protein [Stylosanthes scabra]